MFAELIDRVLEEDDLDQDGYLSYIEYVVGRQRDEKRNTPKWIPFYGIHDSGIFYKAIHIAESRPHDLGFADFSIIIVRLVSYSYF